MNALRLLILTLLLTLGACTPPQATANGPTKTAAALESQPTGEDVQACKARGGQMQRVCLMGEWKCVERYADAGKVCRDKSECLGQCRYAGNAAPGSSVAGECQRTTDPCGCFGIVENGKFTGTLCVD